MQARSLQHQILVHLKLQFRSPWGSFKYMCKFKQEVSGEVSSSCANERHPGPQHRWRLWRSATSSPTEETKLHLKPRVPEVEPVTSHQGFWCLHWINPQECRGGHGDDGRSGEFQALMAWFQCDIWWHNILTMRITGVSGARGYHIQSEGRSIDGIGLEISIRPSFLDLTLPKQILQNQPATTWRCVPGDGRQYDLIILDSVASLISKEELEADISSTDVGFAVPKLLQLGAEVFFCLAATLNSKSHRRLEHRIPLFPRSTLVSRCPLLSRGFHRQIYF